ncbi:MAG: adenylyl-sulfate kinase [Candidatus Dadabacteria bacterium]|nr:adenylyl-sulfate kinase [Candidatus Dadabacteria bacterium]
MERFVIPHEHEITKEDRRRLNGHGSLILWFTGLPSSGKSTLANELEKELIQGGHRTYILDGDNVRMGLCKDLGFSAEDREENIRRIGEVSKLFADAGVIVLSAFVSPYRADRDAARNLVEEGEFVEIFVYCSVEQAEQRDVKGLYKKAREGIIKGFTGIDDPYEEPLNPEIMVNTEQFSIEQCKQQILHYLLERGVVNRV